MEELEEQVAREREDWASRSRDLEIHGGKGME